MNTRSTTLTFAAVAFLGLVAVACDKSMQPTQPAPVLTQVQANEMAQGLTNDMDLLSSSLTMHWSLVSAKNENRFGMRAGLLTTFLLGLSFLTIQINEYVHLGFAPHDTAQGTIFYGLTGLHGAHVFVGLTLLSMATIRAFRGHFSAKEHRGVEVPGIYWHFVDIMWIIVYSTVYVL